MTQSLDRYHSSDPLLDEEELNTSDYSSNESSFIVEKHLPQDYTAATIQYVTLASRKTRRGIARLGLTLLPSYIQHRITGDYPPPEKLHGIAALDGIRGFACLIVFNYHLTFVYTWSTQRGWGLDANNRWTVQLPIVRVFYAGHLMVQIFFVLSGYVLSHKPLKLMRSKSWEHLLHAVTSSLFRRAIRLYAPATISTFGVMLLVRSGIFTYATSIRNDGITMAGCNEQHPNYLESFWDQYNHWLASYRIQFCPWSWGDFYNDYDPHLWTIQFEFRSSMVLFLTLIGFGRLKAYYRLAFTAAVIWLAVQYDRWEILLFLSGAIIAELDLMHGLFQPPPPLGEKERFAELGWWRTLQRKGLTIWLWDGVFVIGLYLGTCPSLDAATTPGYIWLVTLVPEHWSDKNRFWQAIGGVLIVWSVIRSKHLQPAFTNSFAQYMGKISYAFYIVHGPLQHSIGYVVVPNLWWHVTGKDTALGWTAGLVLGGGIVLVLSFWMADLFWRAVDIPVVRFAKWLENKASVSLSK